MSAPSKRMGLQYIERMRKEMGVRYVRDRVTPAFGHLDLWVAQKLCIRECMS